MHFGKDESGFEKIYVNDRIDCLYCSYFVMAFGLGWTLQDQFSANEKVEQPKEKQNQQQRKSKTAHSPFLHWEIL